MKMKLVLFFCALLWGAPAPSASPKDSPAPAEFPHDGRKFAGDTPALAKLRASHTTWVLWRKRVSGDADSPARLVPFVYRGTLRSYRNGNVTVDTKVWIKVCGAAGCRWEWRDAGGRILTATELGPGDQRFLKEWRQAEEEAAHRDTTEEDAALRREAEGVTGTRAGAHVEETPVPAASPKDIPPPAEFPQDGRRFPGDTPAMAKLRAGHTTWVAWQRRVSSDPDSPARLVPFVYRGTLRSYRNGNVTVDTKIWQKVYPSGAASHWTWVNTAGVILTAAELGPGDQRFLKEWRQVSQQAANRDTSEEDAALRREAEGGTRTRAHVKEQQYGQ
jgi:hypothetical protein